ncbi:hypothetical protein [Hyphococcus sp.]|uniref:hypothetical protein n=1 Tax=Hyphococcus sp. TaxID=2038636 RepID=UPI003D0F7B51
MAEKKQHDEAKKLRETIDAFSARLDAMSAAIERMEGRLDVLYEECQRIGGAAQRTILRQESISKSLDRLEQSLREK